MKSLGSPFPIRKLGDLQWWCDLIAYEGPLLSLYHVENRRLYLASWVGHAGRANRWLLFEVSDDQLRSYLDAKTSLRSLITASPLILHFVDRGQGRRNVVKVSVDSIRGDLPAPGSYFEPRFATAEARALASEVRSEYNIHIDGNWFVDDLANAPRLFKQVYAFNHAIQNIEDDAIHRKVNSGLRRPFTGGFSVVGLISDMNEAIPPTSRLRVEAISYHSPGYISVRADPRITHEVERVMGLVSSQTKREALRATYKEANNFLDDHGLRKLDRQKFTPDALEDFEFIDDELRRFVLEILTFVHPGSAADLLLGQSTSLAVLKALIAYVKRLFRLQSYVDDGLITGFGGPRRTVKKRRRG